MIYGFAKDWVRVVTSNGRDVTLDEPIEYTARSGERITVPAGTCSDGASTPRALWRILPPFGPYWLATVLHDYLYRVTQRPKAECDSLLLESMESLGVPKLERDIIYEGVHLGGASAFAEDRKEQL